MKKLLFILVLITAIFVTVIYAADTKTSVLVALTDVDDADIMYIVDAGTSKKITVVNLFDTIDTSLKLLNILTNETGTGALVFATSPTLVTPVLGTIASGVGTTLTALNGENIQDDTIDNDSIDWGDMTDLTTDGALDADVVDEAHIADNGIDSEHYNDGSIDYAHLADDVISGAAAVGTFESGDTFLVLEAGVGLREADFDDLPSGGTMDSFFAEDGDGTEVEIDDAKEWKFIEGASIDIDWTDTSTGDDADPFDLTIKLVVVDDESTNDNQEIVFTTDNATLESDGDFHYNPNTGTVTATIFAGALSGNSTTTTTASAGDAAVDFFGAGVDAVTDATTCTDIEGTGLSIGGTTLNWAAASTDLTDTAALLYETELDDFSELQAQIADKTLVNTADGATWSGTHDFGGANLEIPQASPAVPSVDGEIEFDFADGSLVIQHSSGHAELGSPTDVVIGKLIRCWGGTIFEPDNINDVMTVKAINSIEFPHGVVITAIYLGVSENTSYTLTVQNFDDFDTINGGAPTIDAVTYSADTTGEIIDSAPSYDTIAAGQLIMISIPSTDVDWIHFEIYYYEPAG